MRIVKLCQYETSVSRFCGIVSNCNDTAVKYLCLISRCGSQSNYECDVGNLTSYEQSSLALHCYMLFYITIRSQDPLWHNFSSSLKFSICGSDHKMCSDIKNGLLPLFFDTQYITVHNISQHTIYHSTQYITTHNISQHTIYHNTQYITAHTVYGIKYYVKITLIYNSAFQV
jgi:hypothetical protein